MSIVPSEEDLLSLAELYTRARRLREMMNYYAGDLSPYQRAQLLNYLAIEENSSQQPCLPDKDAPNYI